MEVLDEEEPLEETRRDMRKNGILKMSGSGIFRYIKDLSRAKGTVVVENTIRYLTVTLCIKNNCTKVFKNRFSLSTFLLCLINLINNIWENIKSVENYCNQCKLLLKMWRKFFMIKKNWIKVLS